MSVYAYGMMPPKQWEENQMSEQKRCTECNCDLEKVQCDCAVEVNDGTYKDSLLVEHDVNKCGIKIESSNLLTKSELMAEMQEHADYIRNGYTGKLSIRIEKDKHLNQLWFMFESFSLGNAREYRQDPVAPAKWEPVFFTGKLGVIQRGFSLGVLAHDGLRISFGGIAISCERWCSVNNRNHHSPGWRKEWEPSE